ncbi:MAG: hypothetical protein OQJ74_07485, partial [Ignavibacteriaceae bacterium]|nr:hypothetical protein [Ignavibacteriaceae bacterium]
MKKLLVIPVLCFLLAISAFAQEINPVFADFDKFFNDETMRIDYFHIGNSAEELATLDQIYN